MKVLVDTNIVIDVALERQPFFTDSLKVLTLSYRNDIEAFVSASTISDIYYIIRKLRGREATLEFLKGHDDLVSDCNSQPNGNMRCLKSRDEGFRGRNTV